MLNALLSVSNSVGTQPSPIFFVFLIVGLVIVIGCIIGVFLINGKLSKKTTVITITEDEEISHTETTVEDIELIDKETQNEKDSNQ